MTDDKQAPMCENYDEDIALAMFPSGKVQQFPNLAKAKTMLMRQHYQYLVCTPDEALIYFQELHPETQTKFKVPEEIATKESFWQYLKDISVVRDPWTKPDSAPDSDRMTKRKTAAGYKINTTKAKEFANVKAPKQAKVLASVFATYEDGSVVNDEDVEKVLRRAMLDGVLNTKQPVMRIFSYYRTALLDGEVISLRS